MKIEKISDNQIRCTLNKEDLAGRQLRLSELAYGTEKAKLLFQDMMQQAAFEYGFEADDIPLMIEAIPVNPDCLILVVTKVEDPEELDTRFSKFAPDTYEDDDEEEEEEDEDDVKADEHAAYADNILKYFSNLDESLAIESEDDEDDILMDTDNNQPKEGELYSFSQLHKTESEDSVNEVLSEMDNNKSGSVTTNKNDDDLSSTKEPDLMKCFAFQTLNDIIAISKLLSPIYHGISKIYKDYNKSEYYMILNKNSHTAIEFNKICNMLSEYGTTYRYSDATSAYFDEHLDTIIKSDAIRILSQL